MVYIAYFSSEPDILVVNIDYHITYPEVQLQWSGISIGLPLNAKMRTISAFRQSLAAADPATYL